MVEEIAFDRSLYLPDAIAAAAAAYSEHVHIELTETADKVVAKLSGVVGHDPQTVANAFCNHALYETIVRRRQEGPEEEVS
jgi:hypothetical protein